ncbi:MAG: methionine adenosyltransferase [Eubacteriales bacterium]|nr:methionine adenosyltransferase [Eubacteriales bacterium]
MTEIRKLFTSESVSEGHPDKLCDRVSDAILDACLAEDPNARTAVETLATDDLMVIAGEVTLKKGVTVDYEKIARDVVRSVGYTSEEVGMDADHMKVEVHIHQQSADIAQGVDNSADEHSIGAGDQGIMFGYATDETENYMPLPIVMAHKLVRYATALRKNGTLSFARPDMKSQVTIDYTEEKPTLNAVVFSCQHNPDIALDDLREQIRDKVLFPVIDSFGIDRSHLKEIYINPTGKFEIGGPKGDTGLTGRKIIVDTYGGSAPHGGGAFSGKDPTKVDRSAAYAARYAAKNIVAAGLAKRCLIQLSYAIGVSAPVSISLETYGTETVSKDKILEALVDGKVFDFTPAGIINGFSLRHPTFRYQDLSAYGHFGRPDLDLPYEKLDKVDLLRKLCF